MVQPLGCDSKVSAIEAHTMNLYHPYSPGFTPKTRLGDNQMFASHPSYLERSTVPCRK